MKRLFQPFLRTAIAVPRVLRNTSRSYYYWYPEDMVPRGAATSKFQSSNTPSTRASIIREYALCPLYGSRSPVVVLVSRESRQRFAAVKPQLRALISSTLGISPSAVELGAIEGLEQAFGRRVGKGATICDKLGRTSTLSVDVFISEDGDSSERGSLPSARQQLLSAVNALPLGAADATFGASRCDYMQPIAFGRFCCVPNALDPEAHDQSAELLSVAKSFEKLGVWGAIVPVDDAPQEFDQMLGEEITLEQGVEISERWIERELDAEEVLAARIGDRQ